MTNLTERRGIGEILRNRGGGGGGVRTMKKE